MNRTIQKIGFFALSCALALTCMPFAYMQSAYATPTGLDRNASTQTQIDQVSKKLSTLSTDLESASVEIGKLSEQIEDTKSKIAETQDQINSKKEELQSARGVLNETVLETYKNGGISYISVLLGSSNFDEFASRFYMFSKVAQNRAAAIQKVTGLQDDLEKSQAELEQTLASQEELMAQEQSKQQQAKDSVAAQQNILAGLSEEVIEQVNARNDTVYSSSASASDNQDSSSDDSESGGSSGYEQEDNGGSDGGGNSNSGNPGGGCSAIADIAYNYLGVPYVWGGTSPSGFDCSGLVQYCCRQAGISVSRTSSSQYYDGTPVSRDNLQAGDLVFFGSDLHHVGIYVGGGSFIHAPQTGDVVKVSSLSSRSDYYGACRVG